jgi:hypothetical protein
MQDTASFTKTEKELSHGYLQRVNGAEDMAGVQQAFTTFLQDVLSRVCGREVVLETGDVRVDPDAEDGYAFGPGIAGGGAYAELLEHSDLKDILRRQAGHAVNKLKHMSRHPARDETKLFPRKDRRR